MPVPSGRLRALPIAILATIILLAAVAPVATFANNPPGLARFMNAIAKVELGGRYTAQNTSSGAYGKYQIMPSNWPAWARQYLGNAHAPQTPANQERVAAAKVPGPLRLARDLWRRVAYWWLTGRIVTSGWPLSARLYVDKVMTAYKGASSTMPTAAKAKPKAKSGSRPTTTAKPARATAYSRGWHNARPRRVRRRRGPLLDQGRARPRPSRFTGHPDHLVRPGRPDPRQGPDPRGRRRGPDRGPAHRGSRATRRCTRRTWKTKGGPHLDVPGPRHEAPPDGRDRRVRRPRLTSAGDRPGVLAGGDHLDLDAVVGRQGGHADGRPRGRVRREKVREERVHRREVAEVP